MQSDVLPFIRCQWPVGPTDVDRSPNPVRNWPDNRPCICRQHRRVFRINGFQNERKIRRTPPQSTQSGPQRADLGGKTCFGQGYKSHVTLVARALPVAKTQGGQSAQECKTQLCDIFLQNPLDALNRYCYSTASSGVAQR